MVEKKHSIKGIVSDCGYMLLPFCFVVGVFLCALDSHEKTEENVKPKQESVINKLNKMVKKVSEYQFFQKQR